MRKKVALFLVTAAVALGQGPGQGPPVQQMVNSSVRVSGNSVGGGFVLDARHVATSVEVCCKSGTPTVIVGDSRIGASVAWRSPDSDFVILEVQTPISAPGVTIAPFKFLRKEQAVFTVQFTDGGTKISEGKTIRTSKFKEQPNAPLIVSNAALIERNSGGALFDGCGNVVGMNAQAGKNGEILSYVADLLEPGLSTTGVNVKVVEGCSSDGSSGGASGGGASGGGASGSGGAGGSGGSGSGGGAGGGSGASSGDPQQPAPTKILGLKTNEWITILVVVGILSLGFRKSARQSVVRAVTGRRQVAPEPLPYPYPQQPPPMGQGPPPMGGGMMPPPRSGPRPSLRGLAGQYAGQSIGLEMGPSTLGRDQRAVNLVYPPEANMISKVHCRVSWDAIRRAFLLEDLGSTNGTFLANGERLNTGSVRELRPGDQFYIGDQRNRFEVRLD
jgi:hypothetical protein